MQVKVESLFCDRSCFGVMLCFFLLWSSIRYIFTCVNKLLKYSSVIWNWPLKNDVCSHPVYTADDRKYFFSKKQWICNVVIKFIINSNGEALNEGAAGETPIKPQKSSQSHFTLSAFISWKYIFNSALCLNVLLLLNEKVSAF